MKKVIIYVCILMMSLVFGGCKSDDSHLTEEVSYLSSERFDTVDDLAEFIIENKNGNFKSLFERSSNKLNSPTLTVYTLKTLPNNYDLYDITQHGNFISFNYLNDEAERYEATKNNDNLSDKANFGKDKSEKYDYELSSSSDESSESYSSKMIKHSDMSKITFVWGYNTEGDVYLQNAIKIFGLTEMPDMPDFYYSEADDDYGVHIYQIYWSKDGYCFQLNIPSELFNNVTTYGLKNSKTNKFDFMDLEKTEYILPSN